MLLREDAVRPDENTTGYSPARDLVTGLLGIWLLGAVFVDGWAHVNRPGMESFFTPWHAALYSGLAAVTAWVTFVVLRLRRPGTPLRTAVPAGYAGTFVGILIFSLGGLLDLAWHEVFGIEVALDALISPTHLLLGLGGVLVLGTGVRSQSAQGDGVQTWRAPGVLSLVLGTALVAFFLLYTSAFGVAAPVQEFSPTPEGTPGHEEAEHPVVAALASYLVTTVLLTLPLTYMLLSGRRMPTLGVTAVVATIAWLSVGVVDLPAAQVSGAVGATAGALLADLLLARTRPDAAVQAAPWVSAGVIALVWGGQLAGFAVQDGIGWPPSLWVGLLVLTAGAAAAVTVVAHRASLTRPGGSSPAQAAPQVAIGPASSTTHR